MHAKLLKSPNMYGYNRHIPQSKNSIKVPKTANNKSYVTFGVLCNL